MIFDSVFNPFRGIIAYFKILNGRIRKDDFVKFVNTGKQYNAEEIGVLKLNLSPCNELSAGNVGYIISGIKTSREVKVGDTITHVARPCEKAIEGFQEVKPMVFAGVYPIETEDFENLRTSLEKLQLNDASLTFTPESSVALGFGFRCGFLGLLHMEIVQERLGREFDMDVITTVPNVSYKVYDKKGNEMEVHNPSGLPDPTLIERIEEPYIRYSKRRTKRKFEVNLFNRKFFWVEQQIWIRLTVSAAGLRTINKIGLNAAIKQAAEKGYLTSIKTVE